MIYGVYCVRDLKTSFLSPTVDVNDASAIRNFSHAIIASDNIMHTHRSDFQLFKLGGFDTDTGDFIPLVNKDLIFEGKDVE